MVTMMTQREAERLLGITSPYTLVDLKKAHRRHMVAYHPDKFHDDGADGGMTKAEAEKVFVSGNHAYDTLKVLFAGMPAGYVVTPLGKQKTTESHASGTTSSTGSRTASSATHGTGSWTGSDNSYGTTGTAYGYGASDAGYGTSSAGHADHGTWYGSSSNGTTSDGSSTSTTGTNTQRRRRSQSGSRPRRNTKKTTTTQTTNYTPSPEQTPYVPTSTNTGFSLWTFFFFTILLCGTALWNWYDPVGAFNFITGFIFHPERILILLAVAFVPNLFFE